MFAAVRIRKKHLSYHFTPMYADVRRWTPMDADGRRWTPMDADGRRWTPIYTGLSRSIPVYPGAAQDLSAALAKQMEGEACFNFTDVDALRLKQPA
jgi:hypothetical protein